MIAELVLSSECSVTDIPEPPAAAPAMPSGGMDGMY